MKAILADVHGNFEALQAVLSDIRDEGVDEIYCLGDFVGYGPNPRECVDLLINCPVALLGDHDLAVVGNDPLEKPLSLRLWTRKQLAAPIPSEAVATRRREYLAGLPRSHREGEFLFVHGSPSDPVNEYLFPEDIYNSRKMRSVFGLVDRCCFMGHTHVPGIFTEDMRFMTPSEVDSRYEIRDQKTLINVGSAGQPRDGDRRACYVLLDGNSVRFRRIEYDVETTREKLRKIGDLP